MKEIKGHFPSTTGLCDIHFYIFKPEQPKALVMLSHGMCEYIERYKPFAEFLCENDIALCGNDHIGHGNSIRDENMLGYFGPKNGYINMVRDLHRMKTILDKEFPDIPHFLMGHSMGSFLSRIYISKYGESDHFRGYIISGTAGGITGSAPLGKVIDLVARKHGELYRHKFGSDVVFGMFNLRTQNHRTPNDWLSRDDEQVDKYCADPKCNFIFTIAGYRDLMNALLCCNTPAVIENTPTDLPMLFISGGMDPIGEYGSGVRHAVARYLEHGCDANLRIYREARHELLFELNRKEVMSDILEFLVKRI